MAFRIDGPWFKDEHGRTLLVRGVNLGGSKVPSKPDGATYLREGFFDHRNVSFVGRPFPLGEADEHYRRLRSWGLTFLRFLVPWEAIEHEGPGVYDEAYLDYLYKVIKKADKYGIRLFVEFSQDMWSRFSGGDGAPGWTFDVAGMDITKFKETGAAVVHQTYGAPLPRQIWFTNWTKFAAATMFTLFFAGNDFAPHVRVHGQPIQGFLQEHLINAFKRVAERLAGLAHVVGYDYMNEPMPGYIGREDLSDDQWEYMNGDMPSPYQGMLLGSGIAQEVGVWRPFPKKRLRKRLMNAEGVSLWRDGFSCVWAEHGVWDRDKEGKPRLLKPDYFTRVGGDPVDFSGDYLRPFANRFISAIRSVDPKAILFFTPSNDLPPPVWGKQDAADVVFKPHWYDVTNWLLKRYIPIVSPRFGFDRLRNKIVIGRPKKIRRSFSSQFSALKEQSVERMGNAPTIIGEVGICYDLNNKKAYRTGDFTCQVKVYDRILGALDDTLLGYTLWMYSAQNTNERGDHWNDEDFSIYSISQKKDLDDINSGGRALEAIVRPYPVATAGTPLRIEFNLKRRAFLYEFRHDPLVNAPTILYVPNFQYPNGYRVTVSDGTYQIDREKQHLLYHHSVDREIHVVSVSPKSTGDS
jgi:hypothetical protein